MVSKRIEELGDFEKLVEKLSKEGDWDVTRPKKPKKGNLFEDEDYEIKLSHKNCDCEIDLYVHYGIRNLNYLDSRAGFTLIQTGTTRKGQYRVQEHLVGGQIEFLSKSSTMLGMDIAQRLGKTKRDGGRVAVNMKYDNFDEVYRLVKEHLAVLGK